MKTRSHSLVVAGCLSATFFFSPSPAAAQWSASSDGNTVVCRETGDQASPLLVTDENRGAIIAWHDGRDGSARDVYAQRLNAYGAAMWEEDGLAVCTADSDQTLAGIVSDGTGGALIFWYDRRNGNGDLYAQRLDGSGTALWAPGGVPVAAGSGERQNVAVVADLAGGAVIAWEQEDPGTLKDIFAQRIGATAGILWAAGGVPACSLSADQTQPALAPDGTGGAIVFWSDARTSAETDVYAQRLDGAGAVQWLAGGIAVCAATGNQTNVMTAADGVGGAIAVWEDGRTGPGTQIYTQCVSAAGAACWTPDGVPVAPAAGNQTGVRIAADGSGGAIIAWVDTRNVTSAEDLYAQRLSSAAVPQWGTGGTGFCTAGGIQDQLCQISDGAAGIVMAWRDYRDGAETDIYAARLDPAGVSLWETDGVPVSTTRETQSLPAVAPDGSGGAIVVWEDTRQVSARGVDIYAQNVNADGNRGLPSPSWVVRYNNTTVNKVDGMGFKVKTAAKLLSRSLVVDRFGNSYVTGYSDGGTTKSDYLTVKYDLFGVKVWEARYNGPVGKTDRAYAIVVDNGEVYVTGESQGVDTGYDIATVKYDTAGAQVWVVRYTEPAGGKKDAGYALALVPGEDIVCVTGAADGASAGKTNMVTIAYNATTGAQLWVATYSGPGGSVDKAYAIEAFSLPGGLKRVVITGESDGGPGIKADYATVLYDAETGAQLWASRYNGPVSKKDYAHAVRFDKQEDAIFVTGGSEGAAKFDYATIRYDLLGNQVWAARYDNAAIGKSDIAYDLVLGENGEILVTGGSESTTKLDFTTVKYLVDGTLVWVNRHDGGIGKKDIARALVYDDEGEKIYVTGSSEQGAGRKWDFLTQRIDGLTGLTEWVGRYNGSGLKNDLAFNIAVRPGGGSVVVTGSSIGSGTKTDFATMQGPVDTALPGPIIQAGIPDGDEEEEEEWGDWEDILEGESEPTRVLLAQNYPNPFNPHTTITYWLPAPSQVRLQIYDVLGREVALVVDEDQEEGVQEVDWEPVGIASGLYFYRLEVSGPENGAGAIVRTGKMLLVR